LDSDDTQSSGATWGGGDVLRQGPLLGAVLRVAPAALPGQERHGRMGQQPHGVPNHSEPEKRT